MFSISFPSETGVFKGVGSGGAEGGGATFDSIRGVRGLAGAVGRGGRRLEDSLEGETFVSGFFGVK